MPMTAKHMFGCLAVSAAAAMLSACTPAPPQDPLGVQPLVQPVATPTTAFPKAALDEPLTASTVVPYGNSTHAHDVRVKGIEACLNAAKEHTYRNNFRTKTSCINSNGQAVARFACNINDGRISCD